MRVGRRSPTGLLSGVPLFADCSEDVLTQIADLAEEVVLAAGDELTHQGHRGGLFMVMLQGSAEVRVNGRQVRTLGPGDFVGEIALMVGGRSSATVVATSLVRALVLSEADFQRVVDRAPVLRARIEGRAFERLRGEPSSEPDPR